MTCTLVTVEYSPKTKKVLQCYGDDNAKPSQDIEQFITVFKRI